jgi:hypothetical protein
LRRDRVMPMERRPPQGATAKGFTSAIHRDGGKVISEDLKRIGEKARKNPKERFASIYHHLYDEEYLTVVRY